MKRKRLIGLLLTVALLCIAMVVQLVSAMGPDEDRVHPFYTKDIKMIFPIIIVNHLNSTIMTS